MCRSPTIHGRSASGSASRRAVGAAARRRRRARGRARPARARPRRSSVPPRAPGCRLPLANLVVAGEPRDRGRRQLGLLERPRRRGHAPLPPRPPRAGAAASRWARAATIAASARIEARACGVRPERTWTRSRRALGIAGRVESGFVRRRTTSQSGSSRSARSAARATGSDPEWSSITISLRFGARREELEVDPGREDAVVAGEALGGRRGDLGGGGEQRVDPSEQLLAQRAARRIAEPLRREERRDGERLGVSEREVGDARQARLEAVDDVEAALAQGERDVRADADRNAEARAAGDGDRRPDRDHLRGLAAVQRAAAGEQVGRAARWSEHRDRVPERRAAPARSRPRAR